MNLTPEYKKYIEDARAKGMTDIQIRGALMAAGWTDIQVRDLFDAFKNAEQPAQPKSYDFSMPIASATVASTINSTPSSVNTSVQQKPFEQKPIEQNAVAQNIVEQKPVTQSIVSASRITPQVEPQPLRPYIAQPAYVPNQTVGAQPAVSTKPVIAESRGYVSSEFKPEPMSTIGAIPNVSAQPVAASASTSLTGSGIASYQGGASFSRPVVEQTFSSQQGQQVQSPVSSFYKPRPEETSQQTVGVNAVQVQQSSSFKKVFLSVLAIAFFLSSSVYAYMQFVDPFLLKTDEQVLMESLNAMSLYSGYIRIENDATVFTNGATVTLGADMEYGGENNPDRWSLHVHDVTADGPDEAFEQAVIDGEIKSILSTLDFKVRYVDGEVYVYPGGLAAFFGPDAQEALFEKWIAFTPDEVGGALLGQPSEGSTEVEFNNIFSEIPTTIRNIKYTITDSYVQNRQQYIAISITQADLAEYLTTTLEQDIISVEEVPAIEMMFVINKDKWLAGMEVKATLGEDTASIVSVISPGDADAAILPPSSPVPIEDIMGVIFGGLMGSADLPEGPVENALASVREEIFMQYESSYEKVCTASNKINTEKVTAGELMQMRVTALTDIQGMKTKGDQSAISCYSSADAFVIGAVVGGKTACTDSQEKIGSNDEYVIDTAKRECVVPKVE